MSLASGVWDLAARVAAEVKGKVGWLDAIQSSNPFGGRRLFQSELDNMLHRANHRWDITGEIRSASTNALQSTLTATNLDQLFNNNYETNVPIPAGSKLVLTIDFAETTTFMSGAYPYGYFYVSHYHTYTSASASMRVYTTYAPHGGPAWINLDAPVDVANGASYRTWKIRSDIYAITTLELTVVAGAAEARVSQIEHAPDRPGGYEKPVVDKYRANTLYNTLSWVQDKVVKAKVDLNGVATFLDVQIGSPGFQTYPVVHEGSDRFMPYQYTMTYASGVIASTTSPVVNAALAVGNVATLSFKVKNNNASGSILTIGAVIAGGRPLSRAVGTALIGTNAAGGGTPTTFHVETNGNVVSVSGVPAGSYITGTAVYLI